MYLNVHIFLKQKVSIKIPDCRAIFVEVLIAFQFMSNNET